MKTGQKLALNHRFNFPVSGHSAKGYFQSKLTPLICGIVWTEILLGLRTETDALRIQNLLDAFDTIKDPNQDYIESARIYRTCRGMGFTIRSTIDCVIAQLCLHDNLPLLSKDRDFKHISQWFPLRLVDY